MRFILLISVFFLNAFLISPCFSAPVKARLEIVFRDNDVLYHANNMAIKKGETVAISIKNETKKTVTTSCCAEVFIDGCWLESVSNMTVKGHASKQATILFSIPKSKSKNFLWYPESNEIFWDKKAKSFRIRLDYSVKGLSDRTSISPEYRFSGM